MLETMREVDLDGMMSTQEENGPMMYIEDLDWKLRGIGPGKLVVIGGYVGSYKTLMAINLLYNNAIKLKYNVCFLSLEMYAKEIYRRLVIRHAQNPIFRKHGQMIKMSQMKAGELSLDEEDFLYGTVIPDLRTNEAYGQISIIDSLDQGIEDVGQISRLMEERFSSIRGAADTLDMVIIDYIQLLAQYWGEGLGVDKVTATGKVARWLKGLALTFNGRGLVVVALSQLSRAAYMSATEGIKNSHEKDPYQHIYSVTSFAESSEIERASDVCITIFVDDKLKSEMKAFVQLLKNRDGESIERGFNALAQPDLAYFGGWKKDEDSYTDEDVGNLISDVATD